MMELPVIGVLLAAIAGLANAWTLAHAGTFATVQSGNVVQVGYRLAQGDSAGFWFAFLSVLAFGLGSAMCGIVMTGLLRRKLSYTRPVLLLEAVALAALAAAAAAGLIDSHVVAYAVSFLAGAQGNAFHKTRGMLYGNVAVTFVVQMAFNFLVQSLFKRAGADGEPNLMWAGIFFAVLAGFAFGGCVGFFLDLYVWGHASLMLAAAIALGILIFSLDAEDLDPTPGGVIG